MPITASTQLQFFWQDASVKSDFRTGVSLHSHTMYSEESLAMVPRYTAHIAYLGSAIKRQQETYNRRTGTQFDLSRAFWTPPLTPRQAYRVEEKQIQRRLKLPAVISLTDHDDMRAGALLSVIERFNDTPVSTEWTIPFGPTFFHLGVHNLPRGEATGIMGLLRQFTADPKEKQLGNLLALLNSYRDVLLVLNHPMWDEKGIGASNHSHVVGRLMERHAKQFHALELNGLRSWNENKQVLWLGRQTGLPLVSGGDRHGREPNAILNLSRGRNMVEFIHELRYARSSHIVFMRQYHEPLKLRLLHTMLDIIREYPDNIEGRRTWGERIFFRPDRLGAPVPLSVVWADGGPALVKQFVGGLKLVERRGIRSLMRMALDDRSKVWAGSKLSGLELDREAAF